MTKEEKQLGVERRKQEKLSREHKLINEVDHKICNRHHIHFPEENPWIPATLEYFYHSNKNKSDNLNPYCKRCTVIESLVWKSKNIESYYESQEKYKLNPNRAETVKKHNAKIRAEGYFKEYDKRPEVKARKYGKNHKNHDITEKEWISCKDYFKDEDGGWCCAYCGLKIQDHWIQRGEKIVRSDFHKEHKDPNGYHDVRNCVPSCRNCNSDKRLINFEKWYRKQSFFTEERYDKIIKWTTEDYKDYIIIKKPRKPYTKKIKSNTN